MTKFKLYFFSTLLACFSLTFTSCSKDDDDDDNNSKKEQVNGTDDKGDKEEQGQTPIANDKLVGTWVLNEDASTEKVLFNGIDISDAMGGEGVEDGEEVSTLLSKRVTFKEDGTMITEAGEGKYECFENNQMSFTLTENGQQYTLKKGADVRGMVSQLLDMDLEGLPIDYKSVSVDNLTAVVNGNEMKVNTVATVVMDMSKLQESTDMEAVLVVAMFSAFGDLSNMTVKVDLTDVYNK